MFMAGVFFNVAVFGAERGVAVAALGITLGTVTFHSAWSPEEGKQLATSAVVVSCFLMLLMAPLMYLVLLLLLVCFVLLFVL